MSARQPMRDLVAYLTVLAGPDPAGSYFDLRYRVDRHGLRQRFIDAVRPTAAAAAIAALGHSRDVYVGCAPRRRRAGGKDAITEAWTLWVDCDTQESTAALAAFVPQPAIVVRSGRGLHAYWPLAAPLAPGPLERANRRLARELGGCQSAVTNAAAILRPPTTTNFKYDPPAAVVLERFTGERFSADQVARALSDPPIARRAVEQAEASSSRAADPLLRIEPAVYIEALTGRRVGRDGKVACPFHEDKHPSLQAYPDPPYRWICYSAKCWRGDRPNGGTIYDLAGQLWQLSTRGRDFRQLRRRLHDDFLPGVGPPPRAAAGRPRPSLRRNARCARADGRS
jgi:hypothetical protein